MPSVYVVRNKKSSTANNPMCTILSNEGIALNHPPFGKDDPGIKNKTHMVTNHINVAILSQLSPVIFSAMYNKKGFFESTGSTA